MEKIYCKLPPDALFYALDQPFTPGTVVYCPENHFGVAQQGDNALKFFDEKITVNAKEIPGLKVPFLFGKVQGLKMFFYPYGMSGSFTQKGLTFTSKNGKKAKVSLSIKYKVEIENPYNVLEMNKKFQQYGPCKDGALTRPKYFAEKVAKYILNEGDSAYTKIDMGASWNMHFVEGESSRRPSEMYTLTLSGNVTLKNMFKSFGYKPVDVSLQVLEFEMLN